jgi:hypothetical protein|uniref:DUF131 domain-containing protein n=1 Tax=Ignisphaera aggregans TaxID=334771 RepID=A0A7J3Z8U9_9CREN
MRLFHIGLLLIVTGFAVAFIATLLLVITPLLQQPPQNTTVASGVSCIIIFFIPICFGFGPQESIWLLTIAALALAAVVMVVGYMIHRWSVRIAKELEGV